jgi:ketosteroid isomerase-like protein
MDHSSPKSVVLRFVEYVNSGDIEGMNSLISEDVVFTDILGRVYREHKFMEVYIKKFPDYRIHVQHALQGGNGIAIVGHTTGSHVSAEIEAREVLVWTAEVDSGKISAWRIYSSDEYAS